MTARFARLLWWSLTVVVSMAGVEASAEEPSSVEYKIKAAYLLNFAKFIEWPATSFPMADTPVIFGVLGNDPFGSDLEKTIVGKTIEGRTLRIKRFAEGEDFRECQILFISPSERKRLPQILEKLRGSPILTVSEMDEFLPAGGMINFTKQENTVRFEIELEAASRVHLKMSSKLLQLARVIRETGERRKNP